MAANRLMGAFHQTDPRLLFWNRPYWPQDSRDHIFAARAILELGQAIFGAAWSDDAPATVWKQKLPETMDLFTPIEEIRRGVDLLRSASGSYASRTSRGLLPTMAFSMSPSPFPTDAEWAQAVAIAKSEVDIAWSAYLPFAQVASRLAEACQLGTVKTATRPPAGGEPKEREWHFWNSENLWLRFETCRVDEDSPFDTAATHSGGSWLFIERKSFNEFIAGPPQYIEPTPVIEAEIKEQIRRPRRSGRSAKYDWSVPARELARIIREEGISESTTTASLAVRLADYLSDKWTEVPDPKTLEDKVREWRALFSVAE